MAQREKGWRAPGSRVGRPHGNRDMGAERRLRAAERRAARDGRSSRMQLAELDRRLGPGVGAKRERARLARLIGKAA